MCHCGSDASYEECCGQYHSGQAAAPTAEALMRARYSAFVVENIDFLESSLHPAARHDFDPKGSAQWAKNSEWLGLEVVNTEQGSELDSAGIVEYIAKFKTQNRTMNHHEIGNFVKEDGQWFYKDGETVKPGTIRREGKKIGRNEPCPCGSGKKYKKCCGK